MSILSQLSAAPHPPAGTFSPYSDGEKGDGRNLGALPATLEIGETLSEGVLLPVTIRGEVPGRAMRGSATLLHGGRAS
ncbi:conserved hypothetical protein [Mesorhizobium delmotii]|uniref:Uncharacterized protein n=1 Tax=Mesorhizobium delmotii TaxID=1631247 RepID=A0A2P9AE83_9HYPH|nr:conserved hypothetical protein [Mesorhizobium delmotii]